MWTQCLNLGLRSSIRFAQPREAQLSRVFTQGFVGGAGYDRAEKSKQQVEFRIHFSSPGLSALSRPQLSVQEAFQWLNMRNLAGPAR